MEKKEIRTHALSITSLAFYRLATMLHISLQPFGNQQ